MYVCMCIHSYTYVSLNLCWLHVCVQDQGRSEVGTILENKPNKLISVRWDNRTTYTYRMGVDNCYDLQLPGKFSQLLPTCILTNYINFIVHTYVHVHMYLQLGATGKPATQSSLGTYVVSRNYSLVCT